VKPRESILRRMLRGLAQALGLGDSMARRGWLKLIAVCLAAGLVTGYFMWLLPDRGERRIRDLFEAHIQHDKRGLRCFLYPGLNQMGEPKDLGVFSHVHYSRLEDLPGGMKENFVLRWMGMIKVTEDGVHGIGGMVDDGIVLLIDGKVVIDAWGESAPVMRWGQVDMGTGWHAIEIRYLQLSGRGTLLMEWQPPGKNREPLPTIQMKPLKPHPPLGSIAKLRKAYNMTPFMPSTYDPHTGGRFWRLPW
jgi:hypothetical protein